MHGRCDVKSLTILSNISSWRLCPIPLICDQSKVEIPVQQVAQKTTLPYPISQAIWIRRDNSPFNRDSLTT
jgi:hypothetical protein